MKKVLKVIGILLVGIIIGATAVVKTIDHKNLVTKPVTVVADDVNCQEQLDNCIASVAELLARADEKMAENDEYQQDLIALRKLIKDKKTRKQALKMISNMIK